MSYQSKYLKYKQKYLYLKNQVGGSSGAFNDSYTNLYKDKKSDFFLKKSIFTLNTRSIDNSITGTICGITANTSYVTTYPMVVPFPSSENVALFTLLNKDENNIKTGPLFNLFNISIDTILGKLNLMNGSYCAAGLQELNNTKSVYDLVKSKAYDYHFFMSNIHETYSGTYPSLGFIIKSVPNKTPDKRFLSIGHTRNNNRFSVNICGNKSLPLEFNKDMMYTLGDGWTESGKFVGIRDLGIDVTYLKKGTSQNPDSGRPIACVVEGTYKYNEDGEIVIENKKQKIDKISTIHINAHVPNPSALRYINNDNIVDSFSITGMNTPDRWDIWVTYCIGNIQKCIDEILKNDFGIETIPETTNFLLTGDFNDPIGKLREKLTDGIKILNKTVKFNFGKEKLYTACPNTNSTNAIRYDNQELISTSPDFTKAFKFLSTLTKSIEKEDNSYDEVKVLKDNYLVPVNGKHVESDKNIMHPANYDFIGDYVGSNLNTNVLLRQIDSSMSSDHQFVVASFVPKYEE